MVLRHATVNHQPIMGLDLDWQGRVHGLGITGNKRWDG